MIRRGFTLIEMMVYMAGSLVLIAVFLGFMYRMYASLRIVSIHTQNYVHDALAFNRLLEDMMRAPAACASYKKIAEHEIIFVGADGDCGWRLKKGKLVRLRGSYTAATDMWREKVTSVVAHKIKDLSFTFVPADERCYRAVQVHMESELPTGFSHTACVCLSRGACI